MQTSQPRRKKLSLPASRSATADKDQSAPLMLDTKTLFKGGRELQICHNSDTYRLTITKLGKLILTK